MEEQEQKTTKVAVGANIDPAIHNAVVQFAMDDDRSISNTIERLLKTHPRVQPMLETEPATTGATA